MRAGSGDRGECLIVRSVEPFVALVTGEGEEPVMLPCEVRVDGQPPVACVDRRTAERDLHALVAHRAEVGDEHGVGVRRRGDAVGVEHVGDEGVVIADIRYQPSAEQTHVERHVARTADFPFEVGVGVA